MSSSPRTPGLQPGGSQLDGLQPRDVRAHRLPPDASGWFWRDRLLQGAFAIGALLIAFQLAVTLLQPPWLGPVTDWLHLVLAWLALLVVSYIAWWSSRAHRVESPAWWLLTAALLCYAIARSLWAVDDLFIYYRHGVPFPNLPDLFFALQYPFLFLAIILIPRRRPATPRVIMILDFLLWMGAAVALSWFFMLAPIVTASDLSPLGKLLALSAPVGDLFVLLGLTVSLLRPPYSHPFAPVLGLLIAAFACLILADTWFTLIVLPPPHVYQTGAAPSLFWLTCYLLIPLAALLHLRITQRARASRSASPSSKPMAGRWGSRAPLARDPPSGSPCRSPRWPRCPRLPLPPAEASEARGEMRDAYVSCPLPHRRPARGRNTPHKICKLAAGDESHSTMVWRDCV